MSSGQVDNSSIFFQDELKLCKLLILHYDLRNQFLSLKLDRFLSKNTGKLLSKILIIPYFKEIAIDLGYISEKCESFGLNGITFSEFIVKISAIEVDRNSFWSIIDEIKTRNIKAQSIPVLITEYEKVHSSSNELELISAITRIVDRLKSAIGYSAVHVQDEDDIRSISKRIKLYTGEIDSPQKRFFTGYETMDSVVGGFATSELSIFMGASGIGKTTLLINLAYSLWDFSKTNVHIYSLEMPVVQVMRRFDARIFRVDSTLLRAGEFKDYPVEIVQDIEKRQNTLKVYDFPPKSTVQDIEESLLKADVKPDVVVIDYIGLLRAKLRGDAQLWEINDEVGLSLKALAKKYQIHVMTASQVTTEASKKAGDSQEMYQLHDAAGAKSITQHADIVYSAKFDENLGIMSFESPKFRDGSKNSFQMFLDRQRCYLYDIK